MSETRKQPDIIFLDIDGVLNDHSSWPNSYCGTDRECVEAFNSLLLAWPLSRIVISSAWRYLILSGEMTLRGFTTMLVTHGLDVRNRVLGHTRADADPCEPRINQIREYAADANCENWLALDDMVLADDPRCILVDGTRGLTEDFVKMILWTWNGGAT